MLKPRKSMPSPGRTSAQGSSLVALLKLTVLAIVVAFVLGVLGKGTATLNEISSRTYRTISRDHAFDSVADVGADDVEIYMSKSPRELIETAGIDEIGALEFFSEAGLMLKERDTADLLPQDKRADYASSLLRTIVRHAGRGDYETARYEAQRLVNLVPKMEPGPEVFEINDELDASRKVLRFFRYRFPWSDPHALADLFPDLQTEQEIDEWLRRSDEPQIPLHEWKWTGNDYEDYDSICLEMTKISNPAEEWAYWEAFAQAYPDSPLREDADLNVLSSVMNTLGPRAADGDPTYATTLQWCIYKASHFIDRTRSPLTDDALLYRLRLNCEAGAYDAAWEVFRGPARMTGTADGPLKARYLILESPALPLSLPDEQRSLIDTFLMRAASTGGSMTVANVVDDSNSEGRAVIGALALLLAADRDEVASMNADDAAKSVLRICLPWRA